MAGNGRKDQSGGQVPMMLGLKLVWCGWHVSLCGGLRCSMFTEIFSRNLNFRVGDPCKNTTPVLILGCSCFAVSATTLLLHSIPHKSGCVITWFGSCWSISIKAEASHPVRIPPVPPPPPATPPKSAAPMPAAPMPAACPFPPLPPAAAPPAGRVTWLGDGDVQRWCLEFQCFCNLTWQRLQCWRCSFKRRVTSPRHRYLILGNQQCHVDLSCCLILDLGAGNQ